ncbi:PREDICTED: z-DNA-binding protein 1 [Chrysochloris asiatica]|uniref:Z-DNA-binding protein 1 n=1 Tax=Chrysochloris asiatica TaxID=185453 RepID=A0A9B0TB22_CHRAS|nr:PREDICTED: z-DNA-binding protein 1 [Chrysochloris asiatica]
MAEATDDPGKKGELEQQILRVLQQAGCSLKTAQLVKTCQVPKKEINRVLYQLKEKSVVTLEKPATWCLGGAGNGGVVPTVPANLELSHCTSEEAGKAIYKLLETKGPQSALGIAHALGRKTAKDVNPDLYAMRNNHLLSLDKNTKLWAIYGPDSRRKSQSTENTYQQSIVNMTIQNGPNGYISISNSEGIQIGDNNTIQKHSNKERGYKAPSCPSPMAPDDLFKQEAPTSAGSSQNIRVVLCRQVQQGDYNEMCFQNTLDEGPNCSLPVSATAVEKSHVQSIYPNQDLTKRAQKVNVQVYPEGTTNINKMTVPSVGPEGDRRKDPGESEQDEAGHKKDPNGPIVMTPTLDSCVGDLEPAPFSIHALAGLLALTGFSAAESQLRNIHSFGPSALCRP